MNKILFYISSLNRGGAERVLLSVMNYCRQRYEVVLLTDVYAEDEYDLPVNIRRICLAEQKKFSNSRYPAMLQRLYAIRQICQKEKPQLAIAFMSSSGIRLEAATIFLRLKTAVAIRNNPLEDLAQKRKRKIFLWALKKADSVIFQMNSQKEVFDSAIQKKSVVILNPVSEQFCSTGPVERRNDKIVTVGRLYDYKNHALLIRSFSEIKKDFPQMKLYLYGEGPYRMETEKLVKELGLEGEVLLPGAVTDVAGAIKDATLFVLPSDTEGMPNTLIEAMVLGLPVISTDCPCGGPGTLIQDEENGLLVPVNGQQKLTKAMRKILADHMYAEKLGENARQLQHFCNEKTISNQWITFIEELAEPKQVKN